MSAARIPVTRCTVGPMLGILALCTSVAPFAASAHDNVFASCPTTTNWSRVDPASRKLKDNEGDMDLRLALANTLIEQTCYEDAVHVLEDGAAMHGRSTEYQARLRYAQSLIGEQRYFDGLGRAEEAARRKRNLLRCSKLNDLGACDDALQSQPDDGEILTAKADALMALKRPAEAIPLYRRVSEVDTARDVKSRIVQAEADRKALIARCQSESGDAAVDACQRALLGDTEDEFDLQKRRGVLLQSSSKAGAALDAYIAANTLRQNDKSVALAIVALTDSTGRKDPLTLAARGDALLALNRPSESLAVFRQVQSLDPSVPHLKNRLAAAGKMAKALQAVNVPTAGPASATMASTTAAGQPAKTSARNYSNVESAGRTH